jgi:hypothetical protein
MLVKGTAMATYLEQCTAVFLSLQFAHAAVRHIILG